MFSKYVLQQDEFSKCISHLGPVFIEPFSANVVHVHGLSALTAVHKPLYLVNKIIIDCTLQQPIFEYSQSWAMYNHAHHTTQ